MKCEGRTVKYDGIYLYDGSGSTYTDHGYVSVETDPIGDMLEVGTGHLSATQSDWPLIALPHLIAVIGVACMCLLFHRVGGMATSVESLWRLH